MKRYISAKERENSKHVKPKLLWMDFFDSKCFQYGVNHCKTTFISCLCLSKEGWDTKLSRLVCSAQDSVWSARCAHLRLAKAILKQLVVTLIVVWQPHSYWIRHEWCQQAALWLLQIALLVYKIKKYGKTNTINLNESFMSDLIKAIEPFFSFPSSAYSFLPSNLSSPCLAYGSHRLACLNYAECYCAGERERKGVMFTVPSHGIWPYAVFA